MKIPALTLLLLPLLCSACGQKPSGPAPLRVGMELTNKPFEMENTNGKPDGISVKLAEALAKELGRPLEIKSMPFKSLTLALQQKDIDIILSSMTDTPERRQSISFSAPYVKIGLALLVPAASDVKAADDLKKPGRKIAVKIGTTGQAWAASQYPEAKLTILDNEAACVLEVIGASADAFIYDQLSVLRYHLSQPTATRALLQPLKTEEWAIAVHKQDAELLGKINAFLTSFRSQGGFDTLAETFLQQEKAELKARGIPFIFE